MIVYDAELAHNDTPLSMTAVIGIYDDPDRQRQGRTVIEIGNKKYYYHRSIAVWQDQSSRIDSEESGRKLFTGRA